MGGNLRITQVSAHFRMTSLSIFPQCHVSYCQCPVSYLPKQNICAYIGQTINAERKVAIRLNERST